MRKISSDYLFDGQHLIKNAGIVISDAGAILEVVQEHEYNPSEFEYFPGLITPGFINAHCHLELSHLKNFVPTGTGLLPFISSVVRLRDIPEDIIMKAIHDADQLMWKNGIVAVGDISNKMDTISVKQNSRIKYHTFIEMFDFMQEQLTDTFFENYKKVYDAYGSLSKSFVPHAAYSVSHKLFDLIAVNNQHNDVISIHNQEVPDEDQLFISKEGGFQKFFESFGFSIEHFKPIHQSAVHYSIPKLDSGNHVLLVHNTCTKPEDMIFIHSMLPNVFYVTCPNANLYIENTLPDYKYFIDHQVAMCIGTDSLTSNWNLSILDELLCLQKFHSQIPLVELLKWATYNGAKALRMDHQLGSIAVGKCPGLNWISNIEMDHLGSVKLSMDASVLKII